MLSELIAAYEKTLLELQAAIYFKDEDRIYELDKLASIEWRCILEYDPNTNQEIERLAEFLINHLIGSQPESGINQQIGQKLRDIISFSLSVRMQNA